MAIQYISKNKKNYNSFFCSTFDSFDVIDKYDATIIDYSDPEMWTSEFDTSLLIVESSIKKLSENISNSKKRNIVYLLPRDIEWKIVNFGYKVKPSEERNAFTKVLERIAFLSNRIIGFGVGDETKLQKHIAKSDFFFINSSNDLQLTSAQFSEHSTTIQKNAKGFIYSFLELNTEELLLDFLGTIGISVSISGVPKWVEDYYCFDDASLQKSISSALESIKELEKTIGNNKKALLDNLFYKTILIESGDELVKRVYKILEEMLGIDTSTFVDKKIQDLDFNLCGNTFLLEIKGVNTNIKNEHITQLVTHESRYIDQLNDEGKSVPQNIKKVLIINHQKDKNISERQNVNDDQIKLAKKHDVLIIETKTLLKMYEQFRNKVITREKCIKIFAEEKGIILINE